MEQKKHKDTYIIKSKSAGKALDVCQDGQLQGHIILWDYYGGKNQQFILQQAQNNNIYIKSKQTNKYLTVAANSKQNGVPLLQESNEKVGGQKFTIQCVSPNSNQYVIYTFCGKVLDCFQQNTRNGTKIIQWEFHGKDNQKWFLQKI